MQAIAAGGHHTCALMVGGGVRRWGDDRNGQLGDKAKSDNLSSPPRTDVMGGVTAVAVGTMHACVLTDAGSVRCWGDNTSGQLGNGFRATPAPVLCQ